MSEYSEVSPSTSNRQVGRDKRNRHYAIFENTILANADDDDEEHDPPDSSTTTAIETKRISSSSQLSTTSSSPASFPSEKDRQRSPSPSSSSSKRTSAEVGPSHLFWVPAHLHTDIAPGEFDSFITKHSPPTSPVSGNFPSPHIPDITTDLALDLAYANETNEASLPRLRTLSRRRSSLRRATRIDFDDEGDEDEDKLENETEESMNQRIQMERQKSADRLSFYANRNRPVNETGPHSKVLGTSSLSEGADESFDDVDGDAEAIMENAENDAPGAAAALKRNLSVRLSAMSEYSPENDYDKQTLSRSNSLKRQTSAGGHLLRRGVRTRIRRESLPDIQKLINEKSVATKEPRPPPLSPNPNDKENESNKPLAQSSSSSSAVSGSSGGGVTAGKVVVGPDGEITLIPDESSRASIASVSPIAEVGSVPLPLAVPAKDTDNTQKSSSALPPPEGTATRSDTEQSSRAKGPGTNMHGEESGAAKEKNKDKEAKPRKSSSPWSWFRKEEIESGKKEHHDKAASEFNKLSRKSDPNLSEPFSSSTATASPVAAATPTLVTSVSAPDLHKDSERITSKDSPPPLERTASSTKGRMKSVTSLLFAKAKSAKSAAAAAASTSTSSVSEASSILESTASASSSTESLIPPSTPPVTVPTSSSSSPQKQPTRITNYVTRYPIQVERGIYRLSHAKLANPRRPLLHQVLISNMMFWYLALIARQQKSAQQQWDNGSDDEEGEKEKKERRRAEKEEEKARKKREKEAKKAAAAEEKKKKKKEGKEKEKEKEREVVLSLF